MNWTASGRWWRCAARACARRRPASCWARPASNRSPIWPAACCAGMRSPCLWHHADRPPAILRDILTTLAELHHALAATPLDAALHREMAEARRLQGDLYTAQVHAIAAGALTLYADQPARQAQELCTIATAYFTNADYKIAATLYRLVLAIAPDMAVPYMNLAAMCAAAGFPDDADACRQAAYRIQRVFVEQDEAAAGARRVLLLNAGRNSGNVPIEVMMPTAHWCRIKYIIDYAAEEADAQLPPYDLVFNAIGEPDAAAPLVERLGRFAEHCGRPVLNAPAMIPRTQRHLTPALLAGLEGVYAAPCLRHDDDDSAGLSGRIADAGLAFPLLVRGAATHGGDSLQRCDSIDELTARLQGKQGAHYLTSYHDYRSTDGHYRKYRFIFIDRQPLPYHLAISSNWMVHYFSADMKAEPWKSAEEQRFLDDPGAVLGSRAMDAIAAVARRVDLDYAGIDCTLLPDGRVLVFEANASMLVHHEPADSVFAYKNRHVQRIVDAFQQMLERRLSA